MIPITCLHSSLHDRDPSHLHSGGRGWLTARGVLLALAFGAAMVGHAASPTAGENPEIAPAPKLGDDELFTAEVFQSHLPTTLEKYGLRLSVNPHLGDWDGKDHMRVTTTLRYGLTQNCEISAGSNLFFSHGNGNIRAFHDNGAADLDFGVKLNLGQPLLAGWDTAVGVDYAFPTGHPAPELTDGLRHIRPYATFSHRLATRPEWRIFIGIRHDQISKTSLPGQFGRNSFQETSSGVTGGFVRDHGNLHYTFEAAYDGLGWFGHGGDGVYSVRPGVLWEIPQRRHPELKSNWMIGFAINETYGPGGNSLGASFKVRYNRDLKDGSRRHAITPAPAQGTK